MAVVMSREPDTGGQLEDELGLMSSCHEGDEDIQQFNVPLDGTTDMVECFARA